jgi:hypothetical protein
MAAPEVLLALSPRGCQTYGPRILIQDVTLSMNDRVTPATAADMLAGSLAFFA